jgi:nucleoside-diphosphate-sugar epimerase
LTAILVTGSSGLIGAALSSALSARGYDVRAMDIRKQPAADKRGDVRDFEQVLDGVSGCRGIIHLAAVSRVAWGERDPQRCQAVNVQGTANVIRAALTGPTRPWIVFASSREVYGEPASLPVSEDHPLRPMNVYARSKARGEELMDQAREAGLATATVRFSNVYGSVHDHADRVVPAFCRGAAAGGELVVCGLEHVFDFTHLKDTVRGLFAIVQALEDGETLPAIHLVSGVGTTLAQLAALANRAGGQRARIVDAPERDYDVARFVGDPERAQRLLGWRATITIEEGVRDLVGKFVRLAVRQPSAAMGPEVADREATPAVRRAV